MHAQFAGDVATAHNGTASNEDNIDKIETESEPLESRIDEFKQDSKNMEVVSEFIDDVLQKAEAEVVKQQDVKNGKTSQQPKEKSRQSFTIPDFKNGKMVNRARGLVVRLFDAICNCANTAAAPAQRIKLRAKRATSGAAPAPASENGSAVENKNGELKEKAGKKQENGKEKKPKKDAKEAQEDNEVEAADKQKDEGEAEKPVEEVKQ